MSRNAGARTATRVSFFYAGIALGSLAPLVPLAKVRLGIGPGELGAILLCMGLGSLFAMTTTVFFTSRFSCRAIMASTAPMFVFLLPVIATTHSAGLIAGSLATFGVMMGIHSVAMNLNAVRVERESGRPLMSGFHAMFSLGTIVGSASISGMLALGVEVAIGIYAVVATVAVLIGSARYGLPHGIDQGTERTAFAVPRGVVILAGLLALVAMLAEGAILDWSGLLLLETGTTTIVFSGLGYTLFAISMTGGRLFGDWFRARYGDETVLVWSAALSTGGLLIVLCIPSIVTVLPGFLLTGAGMSNLIPILFTLTGRTRRMPANLALSAVFTVGYAGLIAGPAALGFVAHLFSVKVAFWIVCIGLATFALSCSKVSRRLISD